MTHNDAVDPDTMQLLIELADIVQPPVAERLRFMFSEGYGAREVTIQNADFDLVRLARFVQKTLRAITNDRDGYQQTFDLRWKADMRAMSRWRKAHPGNELVWPDHADLVVWLLDRERTTQ
jgi:hypothetical protein